MMSFLISPKTCFKNFWFSHTLLKRVVTIGSILGLLLSVPAIGLAKVKSAEKISFPDIDTGLGGLQNGDNFGRAAANLGDINADSINDLAIGAYYDEGMGTSTLPHRGAAWMFRMNVNGTVSLLNQNKIADTGTGGPLLLDDGDLFGTAATGIGTLDRDAIPDMVVGAPGDDDVQFSSPPGNQLGAIYTIFLTSTGGIKSLQKISDRFGNFSGFLSDEDFFGWSLASWEDVGTWVAVGAPGHSSSQGACYLLRLTPSGGVSPNAGSVVRIAENENGFNEILDALDRFCSSVGVADFDGDGVQDLIVGAPGSDDGGSNRGKVYILLMNSNKTVKETIQISSTQGGLTEAGGVLENFEEFGSSVAPLGDIDENGCQDIAVGSPFANDGGSNRGRVYFLYLNCNGTVKDLEVIAGSSPDFPFVIDNSDHFGISLANWGDVNGDGVVDIVVGAEGDDDGVNGAGAVYPIFLQAPTDVSISKMALPNPVGVGETFEYVIPVTNHGPGVVPSVTVTDMFPPGFQFTSASVNVPGFICLPLPILIQVVCTFGPLAPDNTAEVRITGVAPLNPSILTNTATVSGTSFHDLDPSNDMATIETIVQSTNVVADVSLTMSSLDEDAVIFPGDNPQYVLMIQNHGPDVATAVTVVNTLPPGTSLVGIGGPGTVCAGSGPITCDLGTLDINASKTVSVTLQAVPEGLYTNSAGVTAEQTDSNFTNNYAAVTVTATLCTKTWSTNPQSSDWSNANNWSGGGGGVPGVTDFVCIPSGDSLHPVLAASTSIQRLHLLSGSTTPGLTVNAGVLLNVGGDVVALQPIVGNGFVQIAQSGAMIQGTFPHLNTENDVLLSGATTILGNLTMVSGELIVNQQHLSVMGDLFTLVDPSGPDGALGMRDPKDRVIVFGNAEFHGEPEGRGDFLSAGTLDVHENFDQIGTASFAPTGSHLTRLNGEGPQEVSFADRVNSFFNEFSIPPKPSAPNRLVTFPTGAMFNRNPQSGEMIKIPAKKVVSCASGGIFFLNPGAGLTGKGTVNCKVESRGGTIVPEDDGLPDRLTFKSLQLDASSNVEIFLNALDPETGYGRFEVLEGPVDLNGRLQLVPGSGFSPLVGTTLPGIISASGPIAGAFTFVNDERVGRSDARWEPRVESTEVNLEVRLVPVRSFDLTVQVNGSGGGSVQSRPLGITCGASCVKTFPHNTVVELVATPDGASQFNGWSGQGCAGSSPTCTVTMSQVRLVTASFCPLVGSCLVPQPVLGLEANIFLNLFHLDWLPVDGAVSYNIWKVFPDGSRELLDSVPGDQTFYNVSVSEVDVINCRFVVTAVLNGQESGFVLTAAVPPLAAVNPLFGWNQVDVHQELPNLTEEGTGAALWECTTSIPGSICDEVGQSGPIRNPNDPSVAQFGTRLFTFPSQIFEQYNLFMTLKDDENVVPDGALGVVFGLDSTNYYRFSIDKEKQYRRLVRREGLSSPEKLAENTSVQPAFQPGFSYFLDVEMNPNFVGVTIKREDSGEIEQTFTADNPNLSGSGFGFYTSGNPGGLFQFRGIENKGDPAVNVKQLNLSLTGTGQGLVTVSMLSGGPPVLSCQSLCSHTFQVAEQVTLTATPSDPSENFTGWEVLSDLLQCDSTITVDNMANPLTVTMNNHACLQATFSGNPIPDITMDIDNDGDVDEHDVNAIQRWMFGLRGAALVEPLANCNEIEKDCRKGIEEVEAYLAGANDMLDVDMDKDQNVMADGNLFARFVAGLRGDDLIAGVVNLGGEQKTVEDIKTHLFRYCAGMCGASAAALTGAPEPEPAIEDTPVAPSGDPTLESVSSNVINVIVQVSQDSTIIQGHPHRNFGASSRLSVGGSQPQHAVLEFPTSEIGSGDLISAQLVLTPYQDIEKPIGQASDYPPLQLVVLPTSFTEGSGDGGSKARRKGKGLGVTWACAVDANIRNRKADCEQPWAGGTSGAKKDLARLPLEFDQATKKYRVDVTAWLREALTQQSPSLSIGVLPTTSEPVYLYSKDGGTGNDLETTKIPYLLIQIKEGR